MANFLQDFFKNNNFKYEGKLAYGLYRARYITVEFKTTIAKVIIAFNQQLGKETGKSISNKISDIKMANNILMNAITTNIHIEMIMYQAVDFNEKFVNVLDKILDILDQYQLKTFETCPLCGQPLSPSDSLVRIGSSVFKAHDNCVDNLVKASEDFEKKIEKKPSRSILLAFLASFISLIIVVGICGIAAKSSFVGAIMILSGSVSLMISRYFIRKFKVFNEPTLIIIRSIMAFLTILLCVFVGSLLIFSNTYGTISIKDFFNYFISSFSDGIIDSKNRIYDIVTGSILMGLSIFTEVLVFNGQRRVIYKIKDK